MKIGLSLSFVPSFSVPEFYYYFFKNFVCFQPKTIFWGKKMEPWKDEKHLKLLKSYKDDFSVIVSNDDYDIFTTLIVGDSPHRHVSLVQEDVSAITNETLYELVNNNCFTSAYIYNDDFDSVQSSPYLGKIDQRKIDKNIWESIKNTPHRIGLFNQKKYDIRFNPGRSELISFTMLMVGWKMWFGEPFFKLVPKERILSFPYANDIKELPNGCVYVQLYDKVEEPYTPDSMFKQWKWREWLDYDGLEEKYS